MFFAKKAILKALQMELNFFYFIRHVVLENFALKVVVPVRDVIKPRRAQRIQIPHFGPDSFIFIPP